jgi:hypothetical protein
MGIPPWQILEKGRAGRVGRLSFSWEEDWGSLPIGERVYLLYPIYHDSETFLPCPGQLIDSKLRITAVNGGLSREVRGEE